MAALHEVGILTPFESPVLEGRREGLDFADWSISRMTAHTVTWNTEQVTGADVPTSYQDLLKPEWAGKVMLEPRAFDWYMTMWKYFEDQGQSESEIDQFFTDLAASAKVVEGFPLQNEFLVTGEMPVAAGSYAHLAFKAKADGAPISFEPFVEPVVIVPSGMGLIGTARAPAMAILFMEYYLTDAQDLLAEQGRVPPRELEEGGMLAGAEFIVTDPEQLEGDVGAQWQERYEALLDGIEVAALAAHMDWALPGDAGTVAQGKIAGVPAKVLVGDPTLLITNAAYADELGRRLGWR
jgi:iron(III) transport system substrate-binding protein